ncbi:hypothetical protein JQ621_12505 [Bradyrhizobium manausense]|nr:hypothetical protein [Bradyrhizobium manausense]MBR1088287.1 hypothetical protein [Bradyrhizobium manausense]
MIENIGKYRRYAAISADALALARSHPPQPLALPVPSLWPYSPRNRQRL